MVMCFSDDWFSGGSRVGGGQQVGALGHRVAWGWRGKWQVRDVWLAGVGEWGVERQRERQDSMWGFTGPRAQGRSSRRRGWRRGMRDERGGNARSGRGGGLRRVYSPTPQC